MSKLQLFALLFGCLLLAAPLTRVNAEDDEYEDDEEDEAAEDDSADKDAEKDVVVLTDDTLEKAIEDSEFALVEFYAPWCGHCKKLAPEYAKAATALKEHDASILIAKVDATEEKKVAEKYGVSGYPTLKWFVKGKAIDYNGPRDSDGIIRWVKKKTGPPADTVETVEQLEKLEAENEVVLLGHFNEFKGKEFDAFLEAARLADDVAFAQTLSKKVATQGGAGEPNSVSIIKNFDGEDRATVQFDKDITAVNIDEFATAEKLPLVIPFIEKNQEKIFDSGIDKQVLLVAKEDDLKKDAAVYKAFRAAAMESKGKLVFVTVDSGDEGAAGAVVSFFGLSDDGLPAVVGFQMSGSKKFKYDGKLDADGLTAWSKGVADGTVEPDYKSEDPPEEDMDGDVKIIVGKTVDTIVKDAEKDVLLEVYAPWCGHCKSLEPIYKKLAKRFAKVDSVVIAKMDGTANEHRDIEVQGFPTLLFFPAEKNAEPVPFEGGDRSLKALTKFIKENAKIPYELPKKKSKSEDAADADAEDDKTEL